MSNKEWEEQSNNVVNLIKEMIGQDVTEINSDSRYEQTKWKYSLSMKNVLVQKQWESCDSKADVFEDSRKRKKFMLDKLCMHYTRNPLWDKYNCRKEEMERNFEPEPSTRTN